MRPQTKACRAIGNVTQKTMITDHWVPIQLGKSRTFTGYGSAIYNMIPVYMMRYDALWMGTKKNQPGNYVLLISRYTVHILQVCSSPCVFKQYTIYITYTCTVLVYTPWAASCKVTECKQLLCNYYTPNVNHTTYVGILYTSPVSQYHDKNSTKQ